MGVGLRGLHPDDLPAVPGHRRQRPQPHRLHGRALHRNLPLLALDEEEPLELLAELEGGEDGVLAGEGDEQGRDQRARGTR